MSDYCEKCKRCHDDGLRNDEECCWYGEPNGCNHPNHGYGVIVDKYEALQKENAELRECLKEACKEYLEYICKQSGTWFHGSACDCNRCYAEKCIVKKWRAALEGGNHAND